MSDAQAPIQRVVSPRPAFGRAGVKLAASPRTEERGAQAVAPAARAAEPIDAFRIGRVFSRAFGVLGRNAVTFLALTVLAAAPERIVMHLGLDSGLAASLSRVTILLCSFALQAAVTRGALCGFAGERPAFGDCVATALRSFLPVLAINLLAALAIGASSLLAVVPGVLLALSWSVAVPVRIAEGAGIRACFSRSRILTDGYRWRILAVALMLVPVIIGAGILLLPVWGIPFAGLREFMSSNWLLRLLLAAIGGAWMASLYSELRGVKEPQQMAAC